MPTTLLTVLQQVAEKAGIKEDDANLVALLQNPALTLTVPEELGSAMSRNIIGLDDAKNNHPAIKSHYFAEVMANVDRSLGKAYSALGLDEDVIEELNRETSSTKRIALLASKVKELTDKQLSEAGKGKNTQTTELQQQIDALNNQLRVEKEARTADKAKFESEMTGFKIDTWLTSRISGMKTIFDTLPPDARQTALVTVLNKELQDSDVKFDLTESGVKLTKKDGSNFYDENNRQVLPDDFIQRTLAKNKILSNAPPAGGNPPANGKGEQGQTGATHVAAGGQNKGIDIGGLIDESLQSLQTVNPIDVAAGQ